MTKIPYSLQHIAPDVLVSIGMALIHFAWASIKTNIIWPMNGPEKFTYILDPGFPELGRGLISTPSGIFLFT